MSNVIAKFRIATDVMNPKINGIRTGYAPHHKFESVAYLASGFHKYDDSGLHYPGETLNVRITFHSWDDLKSRIKVGDKFQVSELDQIVGHGEIESNEPAGTCESGLSRAPHQRRSTALPLAGARTYPDSRGVHHSGHRSSYRNADRARLLPASRPFCTYTGPRVTAVPRRPARKSNTSSPARQVLVSGRMQPAAAG